MDLDGGKAHLEADIGHLIYWRHDPRTRPTWQIAGKLVGEANLKYEASVMAASSAARSSNCK